jgi:aquaglyceroporin related protein
MSAIQPVPASDQIWENSSDSSNAAIRKEQHEEIERRDTASTSRPPISEQTHPIREKLGLHPTAPIHEDHDDIAHNELLWSRVKITLKEPFAEFWGTAIMVFFGNGSVAQVLLSVGLKAAPGGNGYGAYNAISWG